MRYPNNNCLGKKFGAACKYDAHVQSISLQGVLKSMVLYAGDFGRCCPRGLQQRTDSSKLSHRYPYAHRRRRQAQRTLNLEWRKIVLKSQELKILQLQHGCQLLFSLPCPRTASELQFKLLVPPLGTPLVIPI